MERKPRQFLNDEVHDALVEATSRGLPRGDCAALAFIGRRTFYEWLRKGRDELDAETPEDECENEGRFKRLAEAVGVAEAEFKAERIAQIEAAGRNTNVPGGWQANAWLLERRYPQEYGLRQTTVHEGLDRPVLEVQVLMDPEIRALAADLRHRLTASDRPRELNPPEE